LTALPPEIISFILIKRALKRKYNVAAAPIRMEKSMLPVPGSI
jgi:hypothetical protein